MAIWADGRQELLHYEVAETESEQTWTTVFQNLIRRGFDPEPPMRSLKPLIYLPP
jgi:transposase-like protein